MFASVLKTPLYRIAKLIQFLQSDKIITGSCLCDAPFVQNIQKAAVTGQLTIFSPSVHRLDCSHATFQHLTFPRNLHGKKSEVIIFHWENSFLKYRKTYLTIYRNIYKLFHMLAWETKPRSGFFFNPWCIHIKRFSVPALTSFQFE